jgi:hypothetical protein
MSGAHAGFLDGFGTLRPGLSGEIVGIIVRCGRPSALQLQARSPRGWHHFGPNVPDGHQNGLIWGPLIPWNPVNALQSWRRLCDPNGSVRVSFILEQKYGRQLSWDRATTIVLSSKRESKANEILSRRGSSCAPYRPHSSTRCVVFFATDAREIVLVARAPSLRRAGARQIRGAPASASPAARL